MKDTSSHYLDEKGKEYFQGRFGSVSELGRQFQSSYFKPYCDESLTVLDFGCGDGTILSSLPARNRIGIEVNPVCHEAIIRKNAKLEPPISVYVNIKQIAGSSVDLIVSNHCLEHVLNPLGTVREMRRVLRPGGRLVIVTPFDDWRSIKNRTWQPNDADNHLFTWSPLNLGNLLSEAGFEIIDIHLCTLAWSPKIFWVGKLFGEGAFRVACRMLAVIKNRREVFCHARKSLAPHDVGKATGSLENVAAPRST
jgi:SAM-dependent methyltransferase